MTQREESRQADYLEALAQASDQELREQWSTWLGQALDLQLQAEAEREAGQAGLVEQQSNAPASSRL